MKRYGEQVLMKTIVEQFVEKGYGVVPSVFNDRELTEFINEFECFWVDSIRTWRITLEQDDPLGSVFTTIYEFHRYHDFFTSILIDPRMMSLVEKLLGEEAILIGSKFSFRPPYSQEIPLHQDQYDIGTFPERCCTVVLCIDSMEPLNGGIKLIPKSHKLGMINCNLEKTIAAEQLYCLNLMQEESLYLKPGDLLYYDGCTLHGAHPNVSSLRFCRTISASYTSCRAMSLFGNFDYVVDKQSEISSRKVNRKHLKIRDLIAPLNSDRKVDL